jgi:murein DD-endopeptidase MepM/ murein hydrolase activator NlpD
MKFKKIFVFLIALLIPISASAKTLGDLKAEYDALEQAYIEKENEIKENENEQNNTNARIDEIYGEIAAAEEEIKELNDKIAELNKKIDEKNKQIKAVIKYYQVSNGESELLEYLFSAKSITDFIYRATVTEQLSRYNSNLITEMHELILESKKAIASLHEKEDNLKKLQEELRAKLSVLQLEAESLSEEEDSIIKDIEASKAIIQFYIDSGCDESDDISVCANEQLPVGTRFWRPLESGYMTSTWYSDWWDYPGGSCRSHAGVDIGAPTGTPIYSISDGKVVFAEYGYNGGYGNKIVVQHYINGQNYTSLYGHLSSINVNVGDIVTKDSVIGFVGNTGNSYGSHLHLNLCIGLTSCVSRWETTDPGAYINFPPNNTYYYDRTSYYSGYYSNPCGW